MAVALESKQNDEADIATTGSSTFDRVKNYSAVQKSTEYASGIVSNSNILSSYVAPVAGKSLKVATTVASTASGFVPALVKTPVKKVAGKVDELGDRTLQKIEDVTQKSQEKINKLIKETLPLDDEEDETSLSFNNVKERVIVNTKKAAEKHLPESAMKVAGKSVEVAGSAAGAISTAYGAMTKDNIKAGYNACTIENAKTATKKTVTGAYDQCTTANAKKVVVGSASAAKTVAGASIATTKAVAGASLATTKAVAGAYIGTAKAMVGGATKVTGAVVSAMSSKKEAKEADATVESEDQDE